MPFLSISFSSGKYKTLKNAVLYFYELLIALFSFWIQGSPLQGCGNKDEYANVPDTATFIIRA